MKLFTDRFCIRNIVQRDWNDYFEIFGNPIVCQYDDFEPTRFEDAKSEIARILQAYVEKRPEQEFALELKSEKKMVGVLSYRLSGGLLYVGYHINVNYHGRGFATEAMTEFIQYLSNVFSEPIAAVVDSENAPSIRVLQKLGFRKVSCKPDPLKADQGRIELEYRL
ncbi:MAG: GNAT family N-acetyltransferase [bacterium]|nr:GNAT family N-acetyltransferase [bacterium]